MPKQNFNHERLTEDDLIYIAKKSFSMTIKAIAEDLNVTPGAVGYWMKQPYVQNLREKIREALHAEAIQQVKKLDTGSPQTDMFD